MSYEDWYWLSLNLFLFLDSGLMEFVVSIVWNIVRKYFSCCRGCFYYIFLLNVGYDCEVMKMSCEIMSEK